MMSTFTGLNVNPLAMRMEEINEFDISHHLACINRFGGALSTPVSVAQHVVYVYFIVCGWTEDWCIRRQALHHDDSEAYLGDIIKWLKMTPEFARYCVAEDCLQEMIYQKYDCPLVMHPLVEEADRLMVRYEALRGYNEYPIKGREQYRPPTIEEQQIVELSHPLRGWEPWPWHRAERAYLDAFAACQGR